ncbi:hypothetical protein GCM10007425_00470 [Lysinibacillus alkalisoli]|uniref:Uncharacterized protein n=1 Tax=Lysinibacillus alkalisoli TaxID=1911548 RepID=A0A917FWM3_9BACI|nr:hypothetical protein [Lysinibacillus alkalisoli]GGG10028.1 hypothetical protein GCM10007425_00470 [Lysinibacillus alkalisoli]
MTLYNLLKIVGGIGVGIMVFSNDFSWGSFLALAFLALFYIGSPWYAYFKNEE